MTKLVEPSQSATQHAGAEQGPIRLADELDHLLGWINRHIFLPQPSVAALVACWIANTYTYRNFRYCGYLSIQSATPRCGKTRLLEILSYTAKDRPPILTNPTAAVLYRGGWDVLLLDEVDKLRQQDRDAHGAVMAVLNSGFSEGGAVHRTEKTDDNKYEVVCHPVYGPKGLAGIEDLADTLADRCFTIRMERASFRLPRLPRDFQEIATRIRQRFEQWASSNAKMLKDCYTQLPNELPELNGFDDRFQDIAEPLIVLAKTADAERPDGPLILPRMLEGLRAVAGRREPSERERSLVVFLDIAERRLNGAGTVFVSSSDLVNDCMATYALAWIESPKALASLLAPFDLKPGTTGQVRGYTLTREWVDKWRERYSAGLEAA